MSGASTLLHLRGGISLALEESGDPGGTPVFFFHGWPASRLQGAGFGPDAAALRLRILALDRPGIGLSTFQAGRRLLDWPPLVQEVARKLSLKRFGLLAVSGGGPYAAATAYALPDQVRATSIVSGAPPLPPEAAARIFFFYRWMLHLYRRHPSLLRLAFRLGRFMAMRRPPHWLVSLFLRFGPASDRQALASLDTYDSSFACYREAWRGSAQGVATDGEVYAEPWGFPLDDIQCPVDFWHGAEDRSFHWSLAKALADQLPLGRFHLVPGEGHYSLPIHHTRAILTQLGTSLSESA